MAKVPTDSLLALPECVQDFCHKVDVCMTLVDVQRHVIHGFNNFTLSKVLETNPKNPTRRGSPELQLAQPLFSDAAISQVLQHLDVRCACNGDTMIMY